MGAEQSSQRPGRQPGATTTHKTCYYELLSVDRLATDDEIKKAYRRKALELHPDRNLDDTANATRKFAEVQTAYEILSDPQERAWYDSHRDAILSGNDAVSGGAPADQATANHTPAVAIFALMGRFNSSVPMTDSSSGFFGILDVFFEKLASEEAAAAEWDGVEVFDYPPFGKANDDYDDVAKPFYRIWSSFSTKKSFSWMDKYRLGDAPDRRVRRLMEKENKKFRDEGIREFNDAVQSLVSFVRKRDPRYVPNTQSEAERQEILRSSAAAQAARSRAAHQEKVAEYTVPEWAQSRNDDDQLDEFSLSEEESEVEQIECVVCNKIFKSEKQFEAHEKSKKHVKAVQQLQRQMKKENKAFDLDGDKKAYSKHGSSAEVDSDSLSDDDNGQHEEDGGREHGSSVPKEEQLKQPSPSSSSESDADNNDEYAPRSAVEERILSSKPADPLNEDIATGVSSATASLHDLSLDAENETKGGRKIGKAKLKREKKAARQAAETEDPFKCAVCKESFTSKTKLFSHIKELDHAAPVSKVKGGKKQKR
ncbi:hypothetical protein QBC34DRAFT_40485 [Podospora aff. communis PSN243]|uniref:Uncharacterized protein n=1 Tax=Podospora aff. communis PSN243 TaxID=3040156 RepID=A0AAV9GY51_9PEZI|nr:hypothetical protein QBC34DRAFT_40485 [Podospora aff. communis PSN243]